MASNGAPSATEDKRGREATRTIQRMQLAAHVLPISLIQFADYATDVMVVVQLATDNFAGLEWKVSVFAIVVSIIAACIITLCSGVSGPIHPVFPTRKKIIASVLSLLNLHVLYAGSAYIEVVQAHGRESRYAKSVYVYFLYLKQYETGIESVVLGMVTAAALARGLVDDSGGAVWLYASSLALTELSMTYGFFSQAADTHFPHGWQKNRQPASGRFPLFLCMLVHLCWVLATVAVFAAAVVVVAGRRAVRRGCSAESLRGGPVEQSQAHKVGEVRQPRHRSAVLHWNGSVECCHR